MNIQNSITARGVIFMFLMICIGSCKAQKEFGIISNSIDKSFNELPAVGYSAIAAKDRLFLQEKQYLNFLNLENDTFFCVLDFDVSSGNIYTTIWNNKGMASIANEGENKRSIIKEIDSFDKGLILNIQKWDTSSLKEGLSSGDSRNMRISRIILKNKKHNVESIVVN